MANTRPFTLIASAIFGLMALVHLYRLVIGIPLTVGNAVISNNLSAVALVITGILSVMLFREARR